MMRSRAHLGAIFTSIVGMAALIPACSDDTGGVSKEGFEPICGANAPYEPLAGVTAGTPVDYMELRNVTTSTPAPGAPEVAPLPGNQTGVACATATDKEKCKKTLAAVRAVEGWTTGGGQRGTQQTYLVFTRGDEVGQVTSLAALAKFVAPVDTAKDAALLVTVADNNRYIDCSVGVAKSTGSGFEIIVRTGGGCGASNDINEHRIAVGTDGKQTPLETALVEKGDPGCIIGRIPEGLVAAGARGSSLGDYFARNAHLEAASVIAFERLAMELASFGAPEHLIEGARKSAADERRHAETTTRLARRFGNEPISPEVAEIGERSLFDVALENALEGCVRESFGALLATYQAENAIDEEIREAMRTIAVEETDHAHLSWTLHEWACTQLSQADVARIERARDEAANEFALSLLEEEVPEELVRIGGHPPREHAFAMFTRLRAELFQS